MVRKCSHILRPHPTHFFGLPLFLSPKTIPNICNAQTVVITSLSMHFVTQTRDLPVHTALAPLFCRTVFRRQAVRVVENLLTACCSFEELDLTSQPVLQRVFCAFVWNIAQLRLPTDAEGLVPDMHGTCPLERRIQDSLLRGLTASARGSI